MRKKKKEEVQYEHDTVTILRPANDAFEHHVAVAAHAAYESGDLEKAEDLYSEIGDSGRYHHTVEGESFMDRIWNGEIEF